MILRLVEAMDLIRPTYNEYAQMITAYKELGVETPQIDEINEVHLFKNGLILATVKCNEDPSFQVLENGTEGYERVMLERYTQIDLSSLALDVFPHD